ncbi:CAMK protein kinase [Phytophthora megakarya]|uniref:CAMK protein kinase n=1 Tax=Phytophthora megakarya TaxID=4795 RepID=A0A225WYG4_9STRA|nr:CAMK protein kinase [Phytophthora megakarya]
MLLHRDAPSDVECGSSRGSWWAKEIFTVAVKDFQWFDLQVRQLLQCNCEQIVEKFPNGSVYVSMPQRTQTSGIDVQCRAYWAPEIITCQPQDFSVDMWAFGVLAYITLTGVHPFDPRGDKSDAEIVKEIAQGHYDVENSWYKRLSPDAKNFLTQLLGDLKAAFDVRMIIRPSSVMCLIRRLINGDLKAAFDVRMIIRPRSVMCLIRRLMWCKLLVLVLQTFDVNHYGFISSSELEHILHVLSNKHINNEETCKIIQAADKNEDRKIDYDEFCALMQQQTQD